MSSCDEKPVDCYNLVCVLLRALKESLHANQSLPKLRAAIISCLEQTLHAMASSFQHKRNPPIELLHTTDVFSSQVFWIGRTSGPPHKLRTCQQAQSHVGKAGYLSTLLASKVFWSKKYFGFVAPSASFGTSAVDWICQEYPLLQKCWGVASASNGFRSFCLRRGENTRKSCILYR